jgi:hypothetical protein
MESVGGELGGMALGRRQAANGLIDSVYVDQSGLQNRRAINHLGDRGRRGLGGTAALCVEGDIFKPSVSDGERDSRKIPARSPTGSAGESTIGSRPTPALIAQVVLKELAIHRTKGRPHPVLGIPDRAHRAVTHTYLPGGCG